MFGIYWWQGIFDYFLAIIVTSFYAPFDYTRPGFMRVGISSCFVDKGNLSRLDWTTIGVVSDKF
jgi:hypothetical protein